MANVPQVREAVVREFPPLGRYRVRLLLNTRKPSEPPTLDIREYVSGESFEGFTRRGIRISARADMDLLRDVLKDVLEWIPPQKPEPKEYTVVGRWADPPQVWVEYGKGENVDEAIKDALSTLEDDQLDDRLTILAVIPGRHKDALDAIGPVTASAVLEQVCDECRSNGPRATCDCKKGGRS